MQVASLIQRSRALFWHSRRQESNASPERTAQQLGRDWLQTSEKRLKQQKRLLLLILLLLTALVVRFLLPLQVVSVPAGIDPLL